MKIGFVLDDSLDKPDGVQQYVLALGEWLTNKGHAVYYLVGETIRTDITGIHSLSKVLRVRINGNVVGTPFPANKKQIKLLLDKLQLDVIHVQLLYSPVLAGRVIEAVKDSVSVVGTIHIYPETKFSQAMYRLESIMNKKTLARFDEIVAVSKVAAEASHLSKHRKIEIIPNPVNVARFAPDVRRHSQALKIVFLGRLVERKGCLLLLQALTQLKNTGNLPPNLTVEIGGSGALLPKLQAYVAANNLSETVKFLGFIDESAKPAFLALSDIAVFPSSGGESFGIVLIEAMAAKTLVLAGNNPGYSGVMGVDSPQLFETNQPDKLATLLAQTLLSKTYREQRIKQQNELLRQFNITAVGPQIERIYKKTLHSRLKMG